MWQTLVQFYRNTAKYNNNVNGRNEVSDKSVQAVFFYQELT